MTETPKELDAKQAKAKPTTTLETEDRVYTLEGDKDVIESTAFQMRVLKSFEFSTLGDYTYDNVKVNVKNK